MGYLADIARASNTWRAPSCIALPASAAHVSTILQALVPNNVTFAIRSGGHSPNEGFSNIKSPGVLIAMDKLNQVAFDAASGLLTVGPGARWGAVFAALDPHKVTVVGGRVTTVGVGGLLLGSGLSYLSDLYGLACDNVIEYEVVLAGGCIVKANNNRNPDLFWALKGGTNNFGVVTKFITPTVDTIYQGWGGTLVFSIAQLASVLQAFNTYQSAPNKDLYAALNINVVPNNYILVSIIYLKPVAQPAAYAPFFAIKPGPLQQSLQFANIHQLMALFTGDTGVTRWSWYAQSFQPSSSLYARIGSLLATAPEVATISALASGTSVGTFQAITSNMILVGNKRNAGTGGNALGLQAVNQTWFTLNVNWKNAADDTVAQAAAASLHAKIKQLAIDEGVKLNYLFMNDANKAQDVLSSYGGANVNRLRMVQKMYDKAEVFQRLVPGGFKLPPPA
ncbi:hypothetical protein B0T17DRAFT_486116 [Bombardia bombarda]|uniref:FAD-binding PCMH-type domain-containing protein n=1 Tax=Bombardia bombarda TaxID=252184 RepID=A0AA40CD15_9PEZI|nr:hypothetical protein B0T17DRAFT_486116 [Bombardia bombarda]